MSRPDPILFDDWHAVAALEILRARGAIATRLLGVRIEIHGTGSNDIRVVRRDTGAALPLRIEYGYVFTSLGAPARDVVHFPEWHEADRLCVSGSSVGVHASGLRAVENFLDLAHFPFVHTNYLGVEPYTEVEPYKVTITEENEILATGCRFFQPRSSPSAAGGAMIDYEYRVCRPYTACLYKLNPIEPARKDFIALLLQPVSEERCVVHPCLAYLPHDLDAESLRSFQQLIFGQDRPILENQVPKRLPLDPRAEIPARSDATSLAYRRWLTAQGVTYGAIPAPARAAQ